MIETTIISKTSEHLPVGWIRATFTGGLWASIEIIIGSFLHNIRIPFSGTFLTVISITLLIAFLIIWKDENLIWRAGVICAIMKSISPSLIILGPLTGILMEAFILYFIIYIFGKNTFSYLLGGMLSVCSALAHKIGSLLIIYGNDIITLYENFYYYTAKQLGFETSNPIVLITIMFMGYFIIGLLAALLGIKLGKGVLRKGKITLNKKMSFEIGKFDLFPKIKKTRRLLLLVLHIVTLPLLLWYSSTKYYVIAAGIMMLYIIFVLIAYRQLFKRLQKPIFWIQLIILVMIATLFYDNPMERNTFFSYKGFLVGLKMILRAFYVIASFIGISVELTNPRIEAQIKKGKLKNLFNAIQVSFQALPIFINLLPSVRQILLSPLKSLSTMIAYTAEFIDETTEKSIDYENS